jgi:hypothetical protein
MTTSVLDEVVFGLVDTPSDALVWRLGLDDPEPSPEKLTMLDDLRLVLTHMSEAYQRDVERVGTDEDLMPFKLKMLAAIGDVLRALGERD